MSEDFDTLLEKHVEASNTMSMDVEPSPKERKGNKEKSRSERKGKEKEYKDRERERDSRESRDRDYDKEKPREKERERDSRRRERDRDRDREHRDYKDKEKKEKEDEMDIVPMAGEEGEIISNGTKGVVNSNGEIEMSVEETNRIRASLGLKPLKIEPKKDDAQKSKEAEEEGKAQKSLMLKDKLKKTKKQREYLAAISGKSLGEELFEEEESVSSWITKTREKEKDQLKKEKELAERRAKMFEDQDNEYTESDLKGLKVGHDLSVVAESEQIILTLEDTHVLKDGKSMNLEEGRLINLELREKEKLKRNKELLKKKSSYDVYSDKKQDLLPQYNEEKKIEGFTIDEEGIVNMDYHARAERMKERKEIAGKQLYSLDSEKAFASEFLTRDEMIKFKKSSGQNKKKKIRKKEKLDLEPLPETSTKDVGSRDASTKLKIEEEKEKVAQARKERNYSRALEKAAEETKILFDEEQEDASLSSSLQKARDLSAKKKLEESLLAQKLEEKAKKRQTNAEEKVVDNGLLFDETTHFMRAVQPLFEERPKKKKIVAAEDKAALEAVNEEIENDRAEHEKMLRQQAEKERKIREKEEQNVKEEKNNTPMEVDNNNEKELEDPLSMLDLVADKPLMHGSVAATLALLRSKRVDQEPLETMVGRKNDRKQDYDTRDPAPRLQLNYVDEYGRTLTPKEAFRQLSHKFHGKKPGKNKQEKRLKQWTEEVKKKTMSTTDTPLNTVQAMKEEQERTQQPFIVLSGASSAKEAVLEDFKLEKKHAPIAKIKREVAEETAEPIKQEPAPPPLVGGIKEGEFKGFSFPATKKQKT